MNNILLIIIGVVLFGCGVVGCLKDYAIVKNHETLIVREINEKGVLLSEKCVYDDVTKYEWKKIREN